MVKSWLLISADNKAAVVKDILTQLHLVRDGCREAEEVAMARGRGEGWGEGGGGTSGGEIGDLCEGVEEVKLGEEGEGGGGPREWDEREKQLTEPCVDLIKVSNAIQFYVSFRHI